MKHTHKIKRQKNKKRYENDLLRKEKNNKLKLEILRNITKICGGTSKRKLSRKEKELNEYFAKLNNKRKRFYNSIIKNLEAIQDS
jgi:hypothetical protein